eukprot:scaffold24640_cov68-Cyclotella_meneghiniana.AAC.3
MTHHVKRYSVESILVASLLSDADGLFVIYECFFQSLNFNVCICQLMICIGDYRAFSKDCPTDL